MDRIVQVSPRAQNNLSSVPSLLYHHLEPQVPRIGPYATSVTKFAEHLDLLIDLGLVTVSFPQLFQLKTNDSMAKRPLAITFDDGYKSFYQLAMPELCRRKMTATVFLVAGSIGGVNEWDL